MRVRLFDAASGAMRDFCAPRAPAVGLACSESDAAAPRDRAYLEALRGALAHLGFEVQAAPPADLYWGQEPPPPGGGLWLKPGAVSCASVEDAAARGYQARDLPFYFLKRHYRQSPQFSWASLDEAAAELRRLNEAARELEKRHRGGAPHAAGVAGYKKRFRDALAQDLDTPAALDCLWDALRPGALSPGSQLAALRDADQALSLGLFTGFLPNEGLRSG